MVHSRLIVARPTVIGPTLLTAGKSGRRERSGNRLSNRKLRGVGIGSDDFGLQEIVSYQSRGVGKVTRSFPDGSLTSRSNRRKSASIARKVSATAKGDSAEEIRRARDSIEP
jgi:hypothetical protein